MTHHARYPDLNPVDVNGIEQQRHISHTLDLPYLALLRGSELVQKSCYGLPHWTPINQMSRRFSHALVLLFLFISSMRDEYVIQNNGPSLF